MVQYTEQTQEQQDNLSKKEQLLLSNPKELASIVRNQTLIVQNGLSLAGTNGDLTHPLKVYSSFSRFVFVIINSDRKSAHANIRVSDIPGIQAASEYAYKLHMDTLYLGKAADTGQDTGSSQSPAYTKSFRTGNMKGKTPAQVILGAADKERTIEDLKRQYIWLRDNAESNKRYAESNRELMGAIEQAVNLYREGKLEDRGGTGDSAKGTVIELYKSGFRPLMRREKKNGKSFVYECLITWSIGSSYPVSIEIRNYYAHVSEKENGMLNVLVKTKEQEQVNRMALMSAEWQNILYMIRANMEMFEARSRDACYKAAEQAQKRAWQEAGISQQ